MYRANSICWKCKNSTGGCSWSRDLTPVEGWEAENHEIKNSYFNGSLQVINSYNVKKCPCFVSDGFYSEDDKANIRKKFCEKYGISDKTYYRLIKNKRINELGEPIMSFYLKDKFVRSIYDVQKN